MGDPELQAIEFCGVEAPFHIHATINCRALTAQLIQGAALDRALNGHYANVFYQGVRQKERVLKPEFEGKDEQAIAFELGADNIDEAYELRPTLQHMKPSDALVLKMLEAFDKKYRPHQTVEVTFGGRLQLERPGEEAKVIEHQPAVFEDAIESEQRGGHLALARPARDSAELDRWAAEGQFAPAPVAFVDADGKRTVLQATPVSPTTPAAHAAPAPRARPASRDPYMEADGRPKPGGFRVSRS